MEKIKIALMKNERLINLVSLIQLEDILLSIYKVIVGKWKLIPRISNPIRRSTWNLLSAGPPLEGQLPHWGYILEMQARINFRPPSATLLFE